MANTRNTMSSSRSVLAFLRTGTCSETLCRVLDRAYDNPLTLEERASAPLAGGIMSRGYQCGQVWGAALAAGAQAYRLLGAGPQAEVAAIVAAQGIVESFRARYGSIDCRTIIDTDLRDTSQNAAKVAFRYFRKNGVRCFRMAAQYPPVAFGEINAALSKARAEVPSRPVSCAAVLAQKMGASDLHTVMAAGLAGGVGLSGDACGALAAAIWITDMNDREQGAGKVGYSNPRAAALVERFMGRTDAKLECSDIVGRRFESIDDHAGYLRGGGCAEIIDAAAAR